MIIPGLRYFTPNKAFACNSLIIRNVSGFPCESVTARLPKIHNKITKKLNAQLNAISTKLPRFLYPTPFHSRRTTLLRYLEDSDKLTWKFLRTIYTLSLEYRIISQNCIIFIIYNLATFFDKFNSLSYTVTLHYVLKSLRKEKVL